MSSPSFLRDRGIFDTAATSSHTSSGTARSPRNHGSANGVKIRRVTKTNIPSTNNVPTNDNFDDIETAGTIIVSVVENRAREICISKYDTTCGSFVEIYLLTDSHSYTGISQVKKKLSPTLFLSFCIKHHQLFFYFLFFFMCRNHGHTDQSPSQRNSIA